MALKIEIQTIIDYVITCEECGYVDIVTDEENKEEAEKFFQECDWSEKDGKTLCEECAAK